MPLNDITAAGRLAAIDYALLLAYLIILLLVGFLAARKRTDSLESYVLADRNLSLTAFVATLVTTWYGGILGVGEFSYNYGVSSWLVFGVPYYAGALLFAIFLAGRARSGNLMTIPEQLQRVYGRRAGVFGALLVFILITPAPYVLMLGVLCHSLFGWPLWLGVIAGTFFSIVYSWRGGLTAVVRTDVFQFILMYAGFAAILIVAATRFGGWDFLRDNLPAQHLTWHGGNSPQYIFVWYFIALATLIDPNFYQRCFAARTPQIARRGILLAVACWIVFDFMTTATGLYARAILPDLANAAESYPQLALHILPAAARGLFFIALFATIMSTIDSFAFLSAVTLGKDVMAELLHQSDQKQIERYIHLGLALTFVLAIAIALSAQSIVAIWYQIGTAITPALLLPLASSFSSTWRMRSGLALWSMFSSAAITALWMLTGANGTYWFGLEPIYTGLMISLLFFLTSRFAMQLK